MDQPLLKPLSKWAQNRAKNGLPSRASESPKTGSKNGLKMNQKKIQNNLKIIQKFSNLSKSALKNWAKNEPKTFKNNPKRA